MAFEGKVGVDIKMKGYVTSIFVYPQDIIYSLV